MSAASVSRLITGVLRGERARVVSLSVTFVGPARIRTLNRTYLGHDRATDVIAFALTAPATLQPPVSGVIGDVYICPAVARRQASAFGTKPRDELRRLVVHGVLHVLGYDHPDGADRTDSAMWRRQERHLKALR
ncbi:MAG TPA: rRNA maturation RNase YbeY [Gemmatimonadales bacterium]|jgi:probable rRNA maturation factor